MFLLRDMHFIIYQFIITKPGPEIYSAAAASVGAVCRKEARIEARLSDISRMFSLVTGKSEAAAWPCNQRTACCVNKLLDQKPAEVQICCMPN